MYMYVYVLACVRAREGGEHSGGHEPKEAREAEIVSEGDLCRRGLDLVDNNGWFVDCRHDIYQHH